MTSSIPKSFFKFKWDFEIRSSSKCRLSLIQAKNQRTLLVFISTYEDGTPPPSAKWFLLHLQEAATDFRVSKDELGKLTYAVFGCGNSLYSENFNKVIPTRQRNWTDGFVYFTKAASETDRCLAEIGAKQLIRTELADENTAKSVYGGRVSTNDERWWEERSVVCFPPGMEGHFSKWLPQLVSALQKKKSNGCDCESDNATTCCQSKPNKKTNGDHSSKVSSVFTECWSPRVFASVDEQRDRRRRRRIENWKWWWRCGRVQRWWGWAYGFGRHGRIHGVLLSHNSKWLVKPYWTNLTANRYFSLTKVHRKKWSHHWYANP